MKYNFDEIIDRRGTNATSTDGFKAYIFGDPNMKLPYKDEEYIRMWIADMEFATPECVLDAIRARLDRRIFGYTKMYGDDYYKVFSAWTEKMYGWSFPQEHFFTAKGVIPALFELTGLICGPQDKALMLTPAYGYFKHTATHNEIGYVCADLVDREHNGYYEIDFDDFRAKAADPSVKVFLFCNPHNPTGRIWTAEELRKLADICIENDVIIISDEVHCDLIRTGQKHIPLAKLYPDSDRIITCMAPTKTFNMAGMQFSNVIIPHAGVREKYIAKHYASLNPLSMAGARAAYEHGYEWLTELKAYLDANFAFTKEYLAQRLPKATFRIPEATYLGWVDIGPYLKEDEKECIPLLFAQQAGVLLEGGNMFVQNSDTYIRLNLACPRATLTEGLKRICDLLSERA